MAAVQSILLPVPQEGSVDAPEVIERELFIRNLFKTNPAMGCKLLFKSYYGVLCNHALRFVYSKEKAEDIVGDVFCRFWEKKVFENIKTSYRAYLFASVRNCALNLLKKELGKDAVDIECAEQEASVTNPDTVLQASQLNHLIGKAIQSLPHKCQTVFLMSRMDGKKNQVIAKELNISEKSVEAHISKALSRLKNVVKQEYAIV